MVGLGLSWWAADQAKTRLQMESTIGIPEVLATLCLTDFTWLGRKSNDVFPSSGLTSHSFSI